MRAIRVASRLPRPRACKGGRRAGMSTARQTHDCTSWPSASGLVTKLRRASNLSITLECKGVTISKEFEIR
jgi:hypothetical protein